MADSQRRSNDEVAPAPLDPSAPPASASTLGDIEGFPQDLVHGMHAAPLPPRGPGRLPILPALALWAGLVVCVLQGFDAQLALWRLLSERGIWWFPRFPVSD